MNRKYKFIESLTIASILCTVVSNVIAGKIIDIGPFTVSISVLLFPITYILADLYTEVYGYGVGRRVIWKSIFASTFCTALYQLALAYPISTNTDSSFQEAFVTIFNTNMRVVFAGWVVMFAANFANDFTIAKMKVWTRGKHLWSRTISSTIVAEAVDTTLFYPIAFAGILPSNIIIGAMVGGFMIKITLETALTPVTYMVVKYMKKIESEDYYDINTNFNPFKL